MNTKNKSDISYLVIEKFLLYFLISLARGHFFLYHISSIHLADDATCPDEGRHKLDVNSQEFLLSTNLQNFLPHHLIVVLLIATSFLPSLSLYIVVASISKLHLLNPVPPSSSARERFKSKPVIPIKTKTTEIKTFPIQVVIFHSFTFSHFKCPQKCSFSNSPPPAK